jgi:acetylornithine deacetylase/succinyl-diaminopimelate desuccinylase family protein
MTSPEKLLCELIALPSVNPAFVAANDPNAGEQRVADFLAATSAQAGLPVEFQNVSANRPNFITRVSPSGKIKRRILLAPHLDTVPAASEKQFTPAKKNGRIYGRGACDTKGSVAAMLSALFAIANDANRPKQTEIIFAGLIDEEDGQRGSRALADSGLKADLAIVGEPTELKIVTAHKGSLWLQLETRGKAAHGSTPHLGKNAVHEMARIVDLLETKYAAQLRRRRHKLLGHATISVGTISGGTQPNIVPDKCLISADRRILPGETEQSVRREILQLLRAKKLSANIHDSRAAFCGSLETDFNLPLVQKFSRVLGQKKPLGVDYFCDAAVLAQAGIPSVVFGPGNIAQAHTSDEWISLAQLEEATRMLVKFFKTLP